MNNDLIWKYLQYLALADLKTKEYKVMLYLLKKLAKKSELNIKQSKLAEDLGISKSDVSKALSNLEENKLITFDWLNIRKKSISLIEYDEDELEDMISEKIDNNSNFIF